LELSKNFVLLLGMQRPNQSILRNSNPEYSLKGLFLKLKFQYFGHLGKTKRQKEKRWQRMRWLASITNSVNVSLHELWEIVKERDAWHAALHGVTESRLSN